MNESVAAALGKILARPPLPEAAIRACIREAVQGELRTLQKWIFKACQDAYTGHPTAAGAFRESTGRITRNIEETLERQNRQRCQAPRKLTPLRQ
jgi:hypothetical protein